MTEFIKAAVKSSPKISSGTIHIGLDLAEKYGINNGDEVVVAVGVKKRKMIAKVSGNSSNNQTIIMTPAVLKKLYIRSGRRYGIAIDDGVIRLGPIVGVMAETYGETGKPFGAQSYFIKQLISSARKMGEVCFGFSPKSINWGSGTVSGYTSGKNGWIKSIYPIPDVVYPRHSGYSAEARRIRRKLERYGTRFINPNLIGKWQTYKILSQNPNLTPYIPDTRLIINFAQVGNMIKKYRAVYLKPVTGSQGKNIIKVSKRKRTGGYEYQYLLNNQVYRGRAANLQQLRRYLRRVMGNKTYIVQKQINLIRSGGNILDVRILVQKDNTGQWGVTGMAGRVGRSGAITSNISSGGHGRKVKNLLQRSFSNPEQVEKIINEIKTVAVEAASTLEQTIGKSGEMGIDIGVDREGRVWFIEANLRPARQVFLLIGEKGTRMKSVKTPLLYARHLANFESGEEID